MEYLKLSAQSLVAEVHVALKDGDTARAQSFARLAPEGFRYTSALRRAAALFSEAQTAHRASQHKRAATLLASAESSLATAFVAVGIHVSGWLLDSGSLR